MGEGGLPKEGGREGGLPKEGGGEGWGLPKERVGDSL